MISTCLLPLTRPATISALVSWALQEYVERLRFAGAGTDKEDTRRQNVGVAWRISKSYGTRLGVADI